MPESRPVALLGGIEELRERVAAGHRNFAILLAGGAAISRKRINRKGDRWRVTNSIDDSKQRLKDEELWSESNIGEALDKGALVDLDGNDGVLKIGLPLTGGFRIESIDKIVEESRAADNAEQAANDADPLKFHLTQAPGALRMGITERGQWEPADPTLDIGIMEIGPSTVAEIDLRAIGFGHHDGSGKRGASTSIELTIEDIDGIVRTLLALRQDAIEHRNFALNPEGFWTNGSEND